MLLYPERYLGMAGVTDANGTIDRETFEFRHWGAYPLPFEIATRF